MVWAVFHNQIDIFLVVKYAVQFDYIGVVQVELYFHFPSERDL